MQIKDNQVYLNNQKQDKYPGVQFNYYVQTDGTRLSSELLESLHISKDDIQVLDNTNEQDLQIGLKLGLNLSLPVYHFPLTEESYTKLLQISSVTKIKIEPADFSGSVFPLGSHKNWNRDNYGPIWIPKKGATLALNSYNFSIYERCIRVYENNKLEVKNGEYYINDKLTKTYTFKMNYYWMMGDNRHNSADSRYWGFVPEDHVVGRPVVVWLSLEKDKGWFSGKIRFNRFFKNAER
jgi:signal peptidase I